MGLNGGGEKIYNWLKLRFEKRNQKVFFLVFFRCDCHSLDRERESVCEIVRDKVCVG